MKKTLLSTALVAVVAAVAMPSAFAATGKITINGELKAGTCAVTPGSGATGAASDLVVTLDPVQASALSGASSYAGTKAFDISVGGGASDSCNGSVTKLIFENVSGGSLINADGFLDNSATGTATNVGVRLLNGNTANRNLFQVWQCSGDSAQKFFTSGVIRSAGGLCLDSLGTTRNGTLPQLWQCRGYTGQQWDHVW